MCVYIYIWKQAAFFGIEFIPGYQYTFLFGFVPSAQNMSLVVAYKTPIQGARFWEEGSVVTLKVFLPKIGKFTFAESQGHYKGQDKKC